MDFRTQKQGASPPNLPSLNEEEIRLPKFVEHVPEEEEKKEEIKPPTPPSPKKGIKNYLWLIIIVVVLALAYGIWLFWQKGGFKIFQKKEAPKVEKAPAGFELEDEDGDGLTNLQELQYGTNATEKDSDFDGMPDGFEVKFKLNPLDYVDSLSDPDEDKLTNLEEFQYGADPTKKDSDGDGYEDGSEVENGYNPAGPGKLQAS